jgi:LETM1 and EF-hand domain-containing protein 1
MGGHSTPAAPVEPGVAGKLKHWKNLAYDGMRHLYHGSRLLGSNTKLATRIMVRVQKGQAITRRERLLLEKATIDLLRLIPFSVFIIVPFGEALLPVALKMFPGLIPSTFETETQGRNRAFSMEMMRVRARTKLLEYATTRVLAGGADPGAHEILRHAACGDKVSKKDIRAIARHFNTLAPLGWDRLKNNPRVLKNVSQALGVYKFYHGLLPVSYMGGPLNRAIRAQLDKLKNDDEQLRREGLAFLTRDELENANHQRGMRWVDSDAALVKQLQDWVDLGEDELVPYHTLIFIRPTMNSLSDSMRQLPQDTRLKLMNIMKGEVPSHVAENLEELMSKIEKHGDAELDASDETADDIAGKADASDELGSKLGSDLDNKNVLEAIQRHLAETDAESLYDDLYLEHGEVTVRRFTRYLSSKTRASSHEISTTFDALDFPNQGKAISLKTFKRLYNRLADTDDRPDAKRRIASSGDSSATMTNRGSSVSESTAKHPRDER